MRKPGYYWIWRVAVNGWEVAYYDKEGWYSIWDGGTYSDDDIIRIGNQCIRDDD